MNHSHNDKNQNQHSGHDSKHMWWMMACCILLPILLLLFSGRINASGGGSWPWFIFVILFIAMHAGMMFGHGKHDEEQKDGERSNNDESQRPSAHVH